MSGRANRYATEAERKAAGREMSDRFPEQLF